MRPLLLRCKHALRWLWRLRYLQPLTPLGLGVAALAYWLGFRFSKENADFVLYAGGRIALLLLGLAVVGVLATSLGLWLKLAPRALDLELELEAGAAAGTGLRLPCFARWPLVQLRVLWEEPQEVEVFLHRRARHCEELIRPLERGETSSIARRFIVSDVFGFARLGLPRRASAHLQVSPARARVTAHVTRQLLGGDALSHPSGPAEGELIEMRRYAYGDPLRYVLWKAYARTRKLLVRCPERAITPLRSAVAYFVCGKGDEPAASAARFFLEEGLLGNDFLFCADGASAPTSNLAEALQQIILSVRARDLAAEGLKRFLGQLDQSRRQSCVLFVPPVSGPWLARLERLTAKMPRARVITAIDAKPD